MTLRRLLGVPVESWWPTTPTASFLAVGDLISTFGYHRADTSAAQQLPVHQVPATLIRSMSRVPIGPPHKQ